MVTQERQGGVVGTSARRSHPAHVAMTLLARIAWADQQLSAAERALLAQAGVSLGLAPEVAHQEAHFWSTNKPISHQQRQAIRLLADCVNSQSPVVTGAFLRSLAWWAEAIANTDCGSPNAGGEAKSHERECIDAITAALAALCVTKGGSSWERLLQDMNDVAPNAQSPNQSNATADPAPERMALGDW